VADGGARQGADRLAGHAGARPRRGAGPSSAAGRGLAVSVLGWDQPAGATAPWAQAGPAAGGRGDPGRGPAPVARLGAAPGRASAGGGGAAASALSAGLAGGAAAAQRHGWRCRVGRGAPDGLSACAPAAVWGAHTAPSAEPRAPAGSCGRPGGRPGDRSGGQSPGGSGLGSARRAPLAGDVSDGGRESVAGSPSMAGLLPVPPAALAQAAHAPQHGTLRGRRATTDPTPGGLCPRAECGAEYLCDLQPVELGLEPARPSRIDTGGLTSPSNRTPPASRRNHWRYWISDPFNRRV
jgi:hypothetical protein